MCASPPQRCPPSCRFGTHSALSTSRLKSFSNCSRHFPCWSHARRMLSHVVFEIDKQRELLMQQGRMANREQWGAVLGTGVRRESCSEHRRSESEAKRACPACSRKGRETAQKAAGASGFDSSVKSPSPTSLVGEVPEGAGPKADVQCFNEAGERSLMSMHICEHGWHPGALMFQHARLAKTPVAPFLAVQYSPYSAEAASHCSRQCLLRCPCWKLLTS